MTDETAECRGCGMILDGKPYDQGGYAFHPLTGEECKKNHYGGFVCCRACDFKSSLELEQSMPGHNIGQSRLSCSSKESFEDNWPEEF